MYIHEAIRSTTRNRPYIRRSAWNYPTTSPDVAVKILPTDSPDCCLIISAIEKNPRRGWQPTTEDLIASDWETVGL